MSTLSELFPAGGGDNSIDMVATGTLPNGSPVILKADGTVEVVAESITEVTEPASIPSGSEVVFRTAKVLHSHVSFDPNDANKFIIAYRDNYTYGKAVIGTISGTSISFGTTYIFNSGDAEYNNVYFDPINSNKVIISFYGSSNGRVVVGTVSGTSLSFGTTYTFNSGSTNYISLSFDPTNSGKFIIAYKNGSNKAAAIVGTVSGTSLTFGSAVSSSGSENPYYLDVAHVANKFVMVFRDISNGSKGISIVGSVSGTSITLETGVVHYSGNDSRPLIAADPDTTGRFVIFQQSTVKAIVQTLSGTSLSFGSMYEASSNIASEVLQFEFMPGSSGVFAVTFKDSSNSSYGTVVVGTVSGTVITFSGLSVINSATTVELCSASNSDGKLVSVYQDKGNSDYGTAILSQLAVSAMGYVTNLTSTNLLGISQKAAANGETTSVETLGGLSAVHSGLTIGSDYYVATDGSLTTTSTDNVSIGRAVAATTINIRNYV